MWTGYLLREIQKANIAVPEEDESPLAPPPRQVLEIMVSVVHGARLSVSVRSLVLLLVSPPMIRRTVSSCFNPTKGNEKTNKLIWIERECDIKYRCGVNHTATQLHDHLHVSVS